MGSRTVARLVSVLRGLLAIVLVTSMVAAVTTANPPRANAEAPNGVTDLLDILGAGGGPNTLASWTVGLGSVGKLGEPLPLLPASPGGLLGFTDLFSQAVTDELAAATDFGQLAVDKDITIGGGRSGHLITSVSDVDGGKRLDITVTVDKTVTGQDLRLASQTPKVELSVSDGIQAGDQRQCRQLAERVRQGRGRDRRHRQRRDHRRSWCVLCGWTRW